MAARRIGAGREVGPGDLLSQRGWNPPAALASGDPGEKARYTRRSLAAGERVAARDLLDPPLVRRGQPFRVLYLAGGLRLEGQAIARRDGWVGDRLSLRLIGAKKELV